MIEFPSVTRFEVIQGGKRIHESRCIFGGVKASLQDSDRTLKIFLPEDSHEARARQRLLDELQQLSFPLESQLVVRDAMVEHLKRLS